MGRKCIIPTGDVPPSTEKTRMPLTAKEAAKHFRISYWQFCRYTQKRKIPRHKIAGVWRYYVDEIEKATLVPALPGEAQ